MAIVRGGLHGRPSGNVAGVVYGAARTRTGKAVTARELVYPSNPQTADQVLQRNIFKESLDAVRDLSATLWQDDWNRVVGQLPGFHSMMSIILNNTNGSEEMEVPAQSPLGDLHLPATMDAGTGAGATKTIDLVWSTELGGNGTTADLAVAFVIQKSAEVDLSRPSETFITILTRNDAGGTIVCDKAAEQYLVGVYFRGAGAASGLLSPCYWEIVASKA